MFCVQALNRQLDELDRVLDSLEQKNDAIHSQLKELLADSRQVTPHYTLGLTNKRVDLKLDFFPNP